MKLTKQVLLLTLIEFCLLVLPMSLFAAEENLKDICPKRRDKSDAWQQRDENNRCEGIKFSLVTTSTAKLVSVTLKPNSGMGNVSELYLLTHSSTNPNRPKPSNETKEIEIREYKRNYFLDHLELTEEGPHKTFKWSTEILQSLGIEAEQLHGSAQDGYETFAPVVIAPSESPSSLHYEFGIYADEKYLKLISFEIQDQNENVVHKVNPSEDSNLSQHEFITVKWNGKKDNGQPLEQGIYSIFVQVELRDDVDVSYPTSPTYKFLHDPTLFR
ncbi:MAG: FlgD immunoglobulin-like domain containing protein [Xenococcus sp. (in: cyanobacteria)]